MSSLNILGIGLTTNLFDYITPLGQKLQYFSNEIHRICPFISSKYGIVEKTKSMECYNPKLLDDAYKNLDELMLIHADYWGNQNALNCNELLNDWKEFKKLIDNKYYNELNILAIIKTDIMETETTFNLTPLDHNWKLVDNTMCLPSDRFNRLSIDLNNHIQKDLYKITSYPYGLVKYPPHAYIPFEKYTFYLDKETNYIIQTTMIEESNNYRYIGYLDTEASALKIYSNIWEIQKDNSD